MTRREPPPHPNLILARRFEPHRLAPDFLAQAYAHVVPIRRQPLPGAAGKQASIESESIPFQKEAA